MEGRVSWPNSWPPRPTIVPQRALWSSPIHALREVKVEQIDETLILSGSVDTFYHKQLAQELVRSVADGCELVNSIDVQYAARHWRMTLAPKVGCTDRLG